MSEQQPGIIIDDVAPRKVVSPVDELRHYQRAGSDSQLVVIEQTAKPNSLIMQRGLQHPQRIGRVALVRDGVSMTGDYHRVFAARADTLPDAYDEVSDEPDTTATIVLGYN